MAAEEEIGFGVGEFTEAMGRTVIRGHGRAGRVVFVTLGKRDEAADGRLGAFIWLGRSRRGDSGRAVIGRVFVLFLLQATPVLDVARMLVEGFGEDVAARAVSDKIKIARRRRMRRRFKSGPAGVGDRSRRQTVDGVCIVRRPFFDLGAQDRPTKRRLAADQPVDDRRDPTEGACPCAAD